MSNTFPFGVNLKEIATLKDVNHISKSHRLEFKRLVQLSYGKYIASDTILQEHQLPDKNAIVSLITGYRALADALQLISSRKTQNKPHEIIAQLAAHLTHLPEDMVQKVVELEPPQ